MSGRRALFVCGALALVLYVGAFVGLSFGGQSREKPIVAIALGLLVIAALLLQLTLRRVRADGRGGRWIRLGVPLLIMAAGVLLIVYWSSKTRIGTPTGGWGLCGACALYLGAGQALAELRSRTGGAPRRGLWIGAICALLFVAGLELSLELSAPLLFISGLAVLAGPVGLTLLSEDVLRLQLPRIELGAVLGAASAAVGTVLLLVLTELPAPFVWVLVAVLFVLVGAIASSTQADVLLIVTVLALIWASAPHGVPADDLLRVSNQAPRTLVALGDSYMSGEGAKRFFEGTNTPGRNECRRSPTAYAHRIVASGDTGSVQRVAFFACSGATAVHIYKDPQFPDEPMDDGTPTEGTHQMAQLKSLLERRDVDVRLVIVSIGGNDALFSTIGTSCVAPGNCVELGQKWLTRLQEVAARVQRAYRELRTLVGTRVPVLAVPYPQPIRDRPCGYSQLGAAEHLFLHKFVEQLNRLIKYSADNAGFYYLDEMRGAFSTTMRICDGPLDEVGVNFIALDSVDGVVDQVVNPRNWIHNSFHPNERGHERMAAIVEDWLRMHGYPPAKLDPPDDPQSFSPASLPELMGTTSVSYCGGPEPEPGYCDRGYDDWTITQIALVLRDAAIPTLLVAAGWWLVWLPVLARTRPWWKRISDWLADRAFGRAEL